MPSGRLAKPGMRFSRHFTEPDSDGMDDIEWTTRDVRILGADGKPVFEVDGVEVPSSWSRLATDILASKYLRKEGVPDGGAETSARQAVERIVVAIRQAGLDQGVLAEGEAEIFAAELRHLLLSQKAAFNSPVWFNLGLSEAYGIEGKNGHWAWDRDAQDAVRVDDPYLRPQVSACFIQGIKDRLVGEDGIFDLLRKEAQLFKYGSGTGTNFSPLRSRHERLGGGGTSSGLMSFLRVFDVAAGATKSGGTTRRAAKMVCVDMDHPEVGDFIDWKMREEERARALLEVGEDDAWDGQAYAGVSGQNANNSVRVTDRFMQAVDQDRGWETRYRTTGEVHERLRARELWDRIVHAAWSCADPGVQFHDTINRRHTCKASGDIQASNPCSEYMFLDDSACNLASLNLMRFWSGDSGFDVEAFEHAVRVVFTAQEILVTHAGYPTQLVARNSERFRPLGLGYANLGALLMVHGFPYDSPEGRGLGAAITSLLTGAAYRTSAELAATVGPFAGIDDEADGTTNRQHMARVLEMHADAARRLVEEGSPVADLDGELPAEASPIAEAGHRAWQEAIRQGGAHGWRNAQATVIAPTGTIGLLMDCDTTGIEPDFSLVKRKRMAGGGVARIINGSVPAALRNLGYSDREIDLMERYVLGAKSLDGAPVDKHAFLEKGFTEAQYQEAYDHVAEHGRVGDAPHIDPRSMREAGFSAQAVDAMERHVEGHHTLEGSILKDEHLPVFDCANRCGDGTRAIAPLGHVRMMAAAQPFLSGAISKTVNLPHDASEDDVRTCFEDGYRLGLKAVAIYRDGCKATQPLSGGRERGRRAGARGQAQAAGTRGESRARRHFTTAPRLGRGASRLLAALRGPAGRASFEMPSKARASGGEEEAAGVAAGRRVQAGRGEVLEPPRNNDAGFKRTVTIFTGQGKEKVDIHVWEYEDGLPAEIFVGARRSGSLVDEFLKEMGKDYSRILQLGMDLDTLTGKLMNTHGPLEGHTDHPYIKRVLGIQDLLGKLLRYEYFGETGFLSVKPDPAAEGYQPPRREVLARMQQAAIRPKSERRLDHFRPQGEDDVQGRAETERQDDAEHAAHTERAAETERARPGSVAGVTGRAEGAPGDLEGRRQAARDEETWLQSLGGDAPPCDQCGQTMVLSGACYRCLNCGNTMGCS